MTGILSSHISNIIFCYTILLFLFKENHISLEQYGVTQIKSIRAKISAIRKETQAGNKHSVALELYNQNECPPSSLRLQMTSLIIQGGDALSWRQGTDNLMNRCTKKTRNQQSRSSGQGSSKENQGFITNGRKKRA